MKDRGKRELEAYNNNGDCFGEDFLDFPCKKHPASSSSSGGICAYCLTDRLVQLVCPECGEQRLSSCSCSDISSNPNSSADMGNVGRISFLLENEKGAEISTFKHKIEQKSSNNDDFVNLKRSNSTCAVDVSSGRRSETGKLWKIGRLFRKKRDKNNNNNNKNNQNNEENYECNGVSRSRSLCSFRGFYDTEESGGFPVSSSAARASSVSTGNFILDSAKRSCFSESEARISNFDYCDAAGFMGLNPNKNIFSLKETEFVSCDDPAFIDLKLHDMASDSKVPDLAALKRSGLGLSTKEFGFKGGDVLGHEMFKNGGGSCRLSVSERELRKCRKSYKVWRWFFRHQPSSRKYDEDRHHAFKS